jgi:hypothetical protein
MPDAPCTSTAPRIPGQRARGILLVMLPILLTACAGGPGPGASAPAGDPGPSSASPASPLPRPADPVAPPASGDIGAELCRRIADVGSSLLSMRAVELRVPNRVALDIELGKLQVAVGELEDAELGPLEDELETPLTRLGYRLREVELAVEDFRTNSRPQRAAPHVEEDTQTFADELAAFTILSRC